MIIKDKRHFYFFADFYIDNSVYLWFEDENTWPSSLWYSAFDEGFFERGELTQDSLKYRIEEGDFDLYDLTPAKTKDVKRLDKALRECYF